VKERDEGAAFTLWRRGVAATCFTVQLHHSGHPPIRKTCGIARPDSKLSGC